MYRNVCAPAIVLTGVLAAQRCEPYFIKAAQLVRSFDGAENCYQAISSFDQILMYQQSPALHVTVSS